MRYIVSYDLNTPGKDYQRLWAALESLGARRALQSQWVLRYHEISASALRDHFWQFMDSNDRILVTALDGTDWAAMNLMTKLNAL